MWKLSVVTLVVAVAVWMPILLSAAGIALVTALVVAPSFASGADSMPVA